MCKKYFLFTLLFLLLSVPFLKLSSLYLCDVGHSTKFPHQTNFESFFNLLSVDTHAVGSYALKVLSLVKTTDLKMHASQMFVVLCRGSFLSGVSCICESCLS